MSLCPLFIISLSTCRKRPSTARLSGRPSATAAPMSGRSALQRPIRDEYQIWSTNESSVFQLTCSGPGAFPWHTLNHQPGAQILKTLYDKIIFRHYWNIFCWSLLTSGGHIAPVEVDLSKLVAAGQTAPGHCRDHGGPPQYAVSDNSYLSLLFQMQQLVLCIRGN